MIGNVVTRFPGGISDGTEAAWNADLPMTDPTRVFVVFDDFVNPASSTASDVQAWTVVSDGGTGTPVFNNDAAGGIANVVTAAADNDYSAYVSASEVFKITANKKMWFKARVKVAEATTNESTWWVGLTDTTTTGGMQANAAGPLASYDGILFWKTPETAMTLNVETSNAGTQVTSSAIATTVTNKWTTVAFYWDGNGYVLPYYAVNDSDTLVASSPIALTASGMEEMHVVFGVKAGPTAGAETLQVDYIFVAQER